MMWLMPRLFLRPKSRRVRYSFRRREAISLPRFCWSLFLAFLPMACLTAASPAQESLLPATRDGVGELHPGYSPLVPPPRVARFHLLELPFDLVQPTVDSEDADSDFDSNARMWAPSSSARPSPTLPFQKHRELVPRISRELATRIASQRHHINDWMTPPASSGRQAGELPPIQFDDLPPLEEDAVHPVPQLARRPVKQPGVLERKIGFRDQQTSNPTGVQSPQFKIPGVSTRQQVDDDIAPLKDLREPGGSLKPQPVPSPPPVEPNGSPPPPMDGQTSPNPGQADDKRSPRFPGQAPPVETFDSDSRAHSDASPEGSVAKPSSIWWDPLVVQPDNSSSRHWTVGINDLIVYFLQHSPRLRAIQGIQQAAQPAIPESIAEFDPTVFVESEFVRLNDPVGNTLITGGADRFRDNNWTTRAGLRKKFLSGGSLEAFQRLGLQTNNSDFFVPAQQGTAYLALNFTQPLLNGRGRLYNESLIAIASLENQLAGDEAEESIQTELLELTQMYWQLYSARAILFQKKKNVQRAERVYRELMARKDFDVSPTQLFRAEAAVKTRQAELIQAENDVRDGEARISALVGIDIRQDRLELVPSLFPQLVFPEIELGDAWVTALSNRPEILQAGKRAAIAATQANRSRHELLPVLDLMVGTYVFGLDENYEFIDAFGRQFSEGAPGYSAALNFEVPLHRRAAKARLDRNEKLWQVVTSELETRMLEVKSEVDIAVREVRTAYQTLLARQVAMDSARQEMVAQQERLDLSLNDGSDIGNSLNFLLDAQDRLADQENLLARAQASYMVSWVALKKAMGTLVLVESGD